MTRHSQRTFALARRPRLESVFSRAPWQLAVVLFVGGGWAAADGAYGAEASSSTANRPTTSVNDWISELGSPHFVQRERAKRELRRMGVAAFEALYEAQLNDDVEVRKQAAYLLRAIRIQWVAKEDSDAVRAIMFNYQNLPVKQRVRRVDRLALVATTDALAALCRIVRFDSSEVLTRRAALALIELAQRDEEDRNQVMELVDQELESSRRAGADWLRVYALGQDDRNAARQQWQAIGQQEVDALQKYPEENLAAVVRDFLKWRILQLHASQRGQEVNEAADPQAAHQSLTHVLRHQWLPLQSGEIDELSDTVDWVVDAELWDAFRMLMEAFPEPFERPILKYVRADVLDKRGQGEAAQRIVDEILEAGLQGRPDRHTEIALELNRQGRIKWAEREYRLVIDNEPAESPYSIVCLERLGWMCHDQGWNKKAADAYGLLVERMENSPSFKQLMQGVLMRGVRITPQEIESRMYFSRALHHRDQGEIELMKRDLEQAAKHDPAEEPNADIAIAMYRVPEADQAWRDKTMRLITKMRNLFERKIQNAEQQYQERPLASRAEVLALQLNQFAWLVSNTEGDYRAALEASQRSLKLHGEDGGYLDTLARCYYALGDMKNALLHQRRAVELEPHSGQIRMQLEFFESQAAAKQQSGENPA